MSTETRLSDEQVPVDTQRRCEHWIKRLNIQHHLSAPQSAVDQRAVQLLLHGFSDLSKKAHFEPTLIGNQARIY